MAATKKDLEVLVIARYLSALLDTVESPGEGVLLKAREKHCARPGCPDRSKYACGRCKRVHYCSAQCQRTHWKVHKAECSERSPVPLTNTTRLAETWHVAYARKVAGPPDPETFWVEATSKQASRRLFYRYARGRAGSQHAISIGLMLKVAHRLAKLRRLVLGGSAVTGWLVATVRVEPSGLMTRVVNVDKKSARECPMLFDADDRSGPHTVHLYLLVRSGGAGTYALDFNGPWCNNDSADAKTGCPLLLEPVPDIDMSQRLGDKTFADRTVGVPRWLQPMALRCELCTVAESGYLLADGGESRAGINTIGRMILAHQDRRESVLASRLLCRVLAEH